MEDVLGFKNVSVGLRYGDPSRFQGTHRGWDLWAEPLRGRSLKIAPTSGRIIEVRDGNSQGYINCLQVEYTNGPLMGYAEQIGHVAGGASGIGRWRAGDFFFEGDELCECGTKDDGQGVRHFHVEYFRDVRHALAYDHTKAIDPAIIRRMLGERDVYRRPSAFGGGTASSTDALSAPELDDMDICRVAHV